MGAPRKGKVREMQRKLKREHERQPHAPIRFELPLNATTRLAELLRREQQRR
jgi:hypothetical protein